MAMTKIRWPVISIVGTLLFAGGANESHAALITLTAAVSDRGIDTGPRDGVFDGVFGNPSVTQITTPPLGNPGSEERTAIEFDLSSLFPADSIVDSVTLLLSPQGGSTNLGLGAGEVAEVHGYTGDGAIQVADMMVANLVATFGPTPDGQVAVSLSTSWFQALLDTAGPYAGLMFKGVDGATAVLFNFAGTFSGIPVASRPTLNVEYHSAEAPPIPEPGTLGLVAIGAGLMTFRRRLTRRGAAAR
jgi:hypothetical protein